MHLRSLHIKRFRALEDFQVDKLGHVNLIVGKNNSGKSTVLEALQIYANNAQLTTLEKLAQSHNEKWRSDDELEATSELPFKSFFSNRKFPTQDDCGIEIGDGSIDNLVKIEHGFYIEENILQRTPGDEERLLVRRKRVFKRDLNDREKDSMGETFFIQVGNENPVMVHPSNRRRIRPALITHKNKPCSYIPTQFISQDELADEWDKIGLTEAQEFVKKALQIVNPDFEDIQFVRIEDVEQKTQRIYLSRTAIIKTRGENEPIPLSSMGDGILRVLQLFLKLFSAKDGFLLIDEFENGLHYSVQKEVWTLVFDMAKKHNIQIFATTHSWDCIESFAKVAYEKNETEGVLFRIGRSARASDHGKVIATVFDEENLFNIVQSDVEVR